MIQLLIVFQSVIGAGLLHLNRLLTPVSVTHHRELSQVAQRDIGAAKAVISEYHNY